MPLRHLVAGLIFLVMTTLTTLPGLPVLPILAADPINTGFFSDLALEGHDPVAYFTQGEPVEGSDDHEFGWMDATWRFASAENLRLFAEEPQRYAPQYGGYCAWAVAMGYLADGDPDHWKIVDGKLYLNYDNEVQTTWEADIPGFIAKADANWPGVLHD